MAFPGLPLYLPSGGTMEQSPKPFLGYLWRRSATYRFFAKLMVFHCRILRKRRASPGLLLRPALPASLWEKALRHLGRVSWATLVLSKTVNCSRAVAELTFRHIGR